MSKEKNYLYKKYDKIIRKLVENLIVNNELNTSNETPKIGCYSVTCLCSTIGIHYKQFVLLTLN